MKNLTQYIPQDHSWIKDYQKKMGADELGKYYNRVFLKMYNMKEDERLNIINIVKEENFDVFMKCLCAAIDELATYGINFYLINSDTILVRK